MCKDMPFEKALIGLKDGFRMSRPSWGDAWIALCIKGGAFINEANDRRVTYGDYIGMVTAGGMFVPWCAGHDDLLANDWFVVQI